MVEMGLSVLSVSFAIATYGYSNVDMTLLCLASSEEFANLTKPT